MSDTSHRTVALLDADRPAPRARFFVLDSGQAVSQGRRFLPLLFILLCWCVVPLVVSYIISLGTIRLFSTRYLVVVMPPLLLLAGLGIALLPWRTIRLLFAVLLFVAASFSLPNYYNNAEVENWKEVSFWLQQHFQADDGIVCYDNAQGCQVDIEYYLRAYPRDVTFPADSPGSFPWVDYDLTDRITANTEGVVDPATLTQYGAQHPRIFFAVGRLSTDDRVARAKMAYRWLDSHFHFVDQIVTRTVTIRLYQSIIPKPASHK